MTEEPTLKEFRNELMALRYGMEHALFSIKTYYLPRIEEAMSVKDKKDFIRHIRVTLQNLEYGVRRTHYDAIELETSYFKPRGVPDTLR